MGVKVCNVNGSCAYSSVIAGVLHAADSGADVANLSLGGEFPIAGNGEFLGFLNRVFTYANSKRLTVVVSAGNAASDLDHNGGSFASFCNSPNVICASATAPEAGASTVGPWTNVDAIAGYTNFGSSAISVAAPGGLLIANSAGWVWSGCSQTSLVIPTCQTGIFILGASGTSMSSPHVTGLAALLIEDLGKQPGRIKTAIQNSADDLGRKGTDPFYGKGRINVAEALDL
jgi:subtilisin family serine protease